jgi:hypothetical protein
MTPESAKSGATTSPDFAVQDHLDARRLHGGADSDPVKVFGAYRAAARSIVRDETLGPKRCVGLVRLVARVLADHGAESFIAEQVRQIVRAEAREYLETGRTPVAPSPTWTTDPVIRRLRSMLLRGLPHCPECLRPLPSEQMLDNWEDRHRAAWTQEIAREEALGKESGGAV